jgi:hypothetical protein
MFFGTAVLIAGCTTSTPGTAVKPADTQNSGAVVALMDTGPYAVAIGHPFGAVGDKDLQGQRILEAHRIADYTVGPWEVDTEVRYFPGPADSALIGPIPNPELMQNNRVLPDPLPAVAAAHGFIAGFSTVRTAGPKETQLRGLQNVVMEFPDPGAAAAAATEMAAQAPPRGPDVPPGRPIPVPATPEALATHYDLPDGMQQVDSFTARGPYVLFQEARSPSFFIGKDALSLVNAALIAQKTRIDEFTPTALSALPQLPLDPTGSLLSRTLWAPDNSAPFIIGVWQPRGWLHFEVDPLAATGLFNATGVDAVAQRLTTVYQAANADGATRIADSLSKEMAATDSVVPTDGVPGLPVARCFERTKDFQPAGAAMTWRRVAWHLKCVAHVDRWTYTAFSDDLSDVHQQMSAQYRILAGE